MSHQLVRCVREYPHSKVDPLERLLLQLLHECRLQSLGRHPMVLCLARHHCHLVVLVDQPFPPVHEFRLPCHGMSYQLPMAFGRRHSIALNCTTTLLLPLCEFRLPCHGTSCQLPMAFGGRHSIAVTGRTTWLAFRLNCKWSKPRATAIYSNQTFVVATLSSAQMLARGSPDIEM